MRSCTLESDLSANEPIADIARAWEMWSMWNIQIIDGAANATFSVFQATQDEFDAIFPNGRDIEIAVDFFERVGEEEAARVLMPIWERPILKRDAQGIHGTLFYDADERREYLPTSRREVDWDERYVNEAQRRLFREHR